MRTRRNSGGGDSSSSDDATTTMTTTNTRFKLHVVRMYVWSDLAWWCISRLHTLYQGREREGLKESVVTSAGCSWFECNALPTGKYSQMWVEQRKFGFAALTRVPTCQLTGFICIYVYVPRSAFQSSLLSLSLLPPALRLPSSLSLFLRQGGLAYIRRYTLRICYCTTIHHIHIDTGVR